MHVITFTPSALYTNNCNSVIPPSPQLLLSSGAQGVKELQVSLFQTMVVLLFNSRDKMTYIEIKEATAIGELGVA